MLEKLDLFKEMKQEKYKKIMSKLEIKAGYLQREAKALKIPVILVFEGWDAAGRGRVLNELMLALDPRGIRDFSIEPPTADENARPFLWRFWTKTPEKGRIVLFDRSWYGRVLGDRVDGNVKKKVWQRAYEEIRSFERQLTEDGNVLVKLFFHITKGEQKKRIKDLEDDPATAKLVNKDFWRHNQQYDEYYEAVEDMLEETDTKTTPWTLVEAHDFRYAKVKVFEAFIQALEARVKQVKKGKKKKTDIKLKSVKYSVLDKVDPNQDMDVEEYEKALKKCQDRIWELNFEILRAGLPVAIVYEGWDAAGKGGNIKRLIQKMDPRRYDVITTAAPNDVEKAHNYLWRFWNELPKAGFITIFDRSWYGRVMVERVEGFCTEADWKRAYKEINEMEKQWTDYGIVLMKFWLHIDKDEQLRRFKEREAIIYKNWKITEEDWRNRKKWDAYKEVVDEMIYRTSTEQAPWTIIEANSKYYARIKALKTFIKAVEDGLERDRNGYENKDHSDEKTQLVV